MEPRQPQEPSWFQEALKDLAKDVLDGLGRVPKLLLLSLALMALGLFGDNFAPRSRVWVLDLLPVDLTSFLLTGALIVGILLFLLWLAREHRIGLPGVVANDQVIERWGALIGGADGRAETVFQETEAAILQTKVPDVRMQRRQVAPGLLRAVLGGTRSFLVLTNSLNPNLGPYRMYLGARDYGTNLQVSWYVVFQPSVWSQLLALLLYIPLFNLVILPFYLLVRTRHGGEAGFLDLDFFDQQDLTAYVSNAHHCLLRSVEKLMRDLQQDPSMLDRRSRGFLGIS